jgi:hypothetical protein
MATILKELVDAGMCKPTLAALASLKTPNVTYVNPRFKEFYEQLSR